MDINVLDMFHSIIKEWFEKNIGVPSPPQVWVWPEIQNGNNTLIVAPTGAGKTLSAFMECINNLFVQGINGELKPGVQVLYISPLKALNNDIYRNLEVPLKGIEDLCMEKGIEFPKITKSVRTGDTSPAERRRIIKTPPHILITTPESLYLMLTSKNAWPVLKDVKYLIIDEIHTLLDSKRGVHLSISVERLAHIVGKPFTRIGLSATVRPLDEAAKYLGGFQREGDAWIQRPVTIVEPIMDKQVDLNIAVPVKDYRTLEEGSIWPEIYNRIFELVKQHKSTIVFVNNRAVAEKVSANLNSIAGGIIARTHHGCISKEARLAVEKQLKNGELPCLVSTSSLELGIDVGAIDLMIQVASPKSAARGLQRLGRAGHKLNAVSKGRIIPKTRGDLLEASIIAREMLDRSIEEERVPKNCLDVLAQHIVSMSCMKEWNVNELMEVVMSSYPYQTLSPYEAEKVLEMLSGDYEHMEDSPRNPMITWDRVNRLIRGDTYSRMLAVSGTGTIPDRGYYPVYLEDKKTRLGELDETFVYEARVGHRFMLGTTPWKIERIEKDRVIVSQCSSAGAKTPFWTGEGLGRPYELGVRFGEYMRELSNKAGSDDFLPWILSVIPIDEVGARNLEQYILDQKNVLGCISNEKRIIVEYFSDDSGEIKIVIHSHFGGRVNEGIAMIMEYELTRELHCQAQASSNDDGILITLMGLNEYPRNIFSLVKPENIENLIVDILPQTPLFSINFRHNGARALMMGTKKFGKRSPLWMQRIRGMELLQLAEKYPDHPLIIETYRECMNTILDIPHIIEVIEKISSREIEVVEKVTSHPSPFTSELLFNFMGVAMYEGLLPNPKKPEQKLVTGKTNLSYGKINPSSKNLIDKKAILEIVSKNNPLKKQQRINSIDRLYSMLQTYGDIDGTGENMIMLGEICDVSPSEWFSSLINQGRVRVLDRENRKLYIAAEEYPMYAAAVGLEEGIWTQEEAVYRIVRRFARYNSPFVYEDVAERYSIPTDLIKKVVLRLEQDGMLARGAFVDPDREEWYHSIILERIRIHTMHTSRKAANTRDESFFADFLPRWQGIGKEAISPVEKLYDTIVQLRGLYLPVEWWEEFIFPSRIKGYRKSHLDKLCSTGRVIWRIRPLEGTQKLAWYVTEDLDNAADEPEMPQLAAQGERQVYDLLIRKGASFIHTICAQTGMSNLDILTSLEGLVWKGIVVNDSFESIRYFIAENSTNTKAKAKKRANAYKAEMGRWEIAQGIRQPALEDYISLLFKRYGLVTKEIFQYEKTQQLWKEAYELLKQWEYIGKINRGYYIEGLSGMQFVLPECFHMLENPSEQYIVVNTSDPAQAYGQIVPRNIEKSQWMCSVGNAVVLKSGKPVITAEGYGERMNTYTDDREEITHALSAFVEAFHCGQVWSSRNRVRLKYWNNEPCTKCESVDELRRLGFEPEMMEMVLWKRV